MAFSNLHRKAKECVANVQTILYEDDTIDKALQNIRGKDIHDQVLYFYVLNHEGKLVGVVSTRELLLRDKEKTIKEMMSKNIIYLHEDQTLDEAMVIMESQQLLALPVLDHEGKFLGVIDVSHYLEESVDVANTKKRMQIFQMMGFVLDEGKQVSTWHSYRSRMPWIFCNMFGGLACAVISRLYELVLSKVLLLAMFIPLVLSLSESISMQAMAQSLHLPHSSKYGKEHPLKKIFRQWKIFSLLAVSCGVIVGGISLFWGDGIEPAFVIMAGIMISIFITALIGAAVPILLHTKRLDPKVASGPVVLMMADVITTTIYLTIATWLLL